MVGRVSGAEQGAKTSSRGKRGAEMLQTMQAIKWDAMTYTDIDDYINIGEYIDVGEL